MKDVLQLSAIELATLIDRGELGCEELAKFFLDRIDTHNHALHAFVHIDAETTLRQARSVQKLDTKSALHGVPIAIKDMNLVRGWPARFGARALRGLVAPRDDKSVASMRRAGLVFLGKTAVPEFGTIPVTEPEIHPATRSPWSDAFTPGGSSGGSAVAVAAGLAPIAQGSDGGGSIRIPAALNHLFGLKPSRGVVPNAYGLPDKNIIYTDGPLTHTVADCAALLEVMSPRFQMMGPVPLHQRIEQAPRSLRIGFVTASPLHEAPAHVEAAVRRVADVLRQLGHTLIETTLPEGDATDFMMIWKSLISTLPPLPDFEPFNVFLRETGANISRKDALEATRRLSELTLRPFETIDVLLTPTLAGLPLRRGMLKNLEGEALLQACTPIAALTAPFNASGQPAASVPFDFDEDGMPHAVQLVGKLDDDELILALSRQIEIALPWAHRTTVHRS